MVSGSFVAVGVAALVGAPHCLGMCGALAMVGSRGQRALPYHLGRVLVYAGLGVLAGAFGAAIPGPSWVATVLSAVLLVVFSAALAGWLPEPQRVVPGLARAAAWLAKRPGPGVAFGLGLVNGLLPCGLLYATLAVPIALGDPLWGAGVMVFFGGLTSLPLTAASLGLRTALRRRPRLRLLAAGGVLVLGSWSLLGRSGLEPSAAQAGQAMAAETEVPAPECH